MPEYSISTHAEIKRLAHELELERAATAREAAEARRWRLIAQALNGKLRELAFLSERAVVVFDADALVQLQHSPDVRR